MTNELRLMLVLAHPDDESLGNGGMIAKYVDEGVEVSLVVATRGEAGWFYDPADNPGPEALGRIREGELRDAAGVLGIEDISFLDYRDGELPDADPREAVAQITGHIRRVRPHVVVTFDQNGLYGHPDHMAICQFSTAAVAAAADRELDDGQQPHPVSKLYYMAWTDEDVNVYQKAFGPLEMTIEGEQRKSVPWPKWSITTRIDAPDHWQRAWEAIEKHRTQLPGYEKLLALPEEDHQRMWGSYYYYRAFSRVNGGTNLETDLFEGLREAASRMTNLLSVAI